jgi:2-polyprenyl-3-methyl-5-hydroxy-6-metoxy-1,4-benzoquinol methylase
MTHDGRADRQERGPQPLAWTPELVARFWSSVWTTRLKEFSFARQAGRALIVALDHLWSPGSSVLDFGAGPGDLTALLLDRGVRVAAYDPSAEARAMLERRFAGRSDFIGAVGPDENRQFDIVILAEVIEHVLTSEFELTLGRVARYVRRKGLVVVTTPNNEDLELGMCVDPVNNVMFHRWQHVRSFDRQSLATTLAAFGFAEVVTHEIELSEHLYVPHDPRWGQGGELPSHLIAMRANQPCRMGGQQNLVYVGTKSD